MLQYFGDEDGRDHFHTTVRSLRTDRQCGSRWDRWKTRLQYYIDVRGITVDNRKQALLLHLAGPAVQEGFATLSYTGTTDMEALTVLNTHFSPQKSLPFERQTFRQAHRAPNESIAQYVTRLRRLGEQCDFDKYSLDKAIKLIKHCHSTTLCRRLLAKHSLLLSVHCWILLAPWSRPIFSGELWECLVPGTLGKRSPTDNANHKRKRTSEFYFAEAATMYTLR